MSIDEMNLETLENFLVENSDTQGIPSGVNFELTNNNFVDKNWFIPIPDNHPEPNGYKERSALGATIYNAIEEDFNYAIENDLDEMYIDIAHLGDSSSNFFVANIDDKNSHCFNYSGTIFGKLKEKIEAFGKKVTIRYLAGITKPKESSEFSSSDPVVYQLNEHIAVLELSLIHI